MFSIVSTCCIVSCNSDSPSAKPPSTTVPSEEVTKEKAAPKEKDERLTWQKPELVISKLGNIQDKTIADIGAGIGYFSFKLLPKCKKVIATDIDKETIQILSGFKNSLDEERQKKFDVRLATESDTGLKQNEADIVFIVNTITYIPNRASYLKDLTNYLSDNGMIFIVDYKSKRIPEFTSPPRMSERLYMHVLEDELETAGYQLMETDDTTLDYQYIITATKKAL